MVSHGKGFIRGKRGKLNSNVKICARKGEEYHDWRIESLIVPITSVDDARSSIFLA
jgi:hypothetical protein